MKNQLSKATGNFLRRQLAKRIEQLASHIKALEQECPKQIKQDEELARRFVILTSIPGIAMVGATTAITCLSELGSLTNKQVAALAGFAPLADDCGERDGVRAIWGSRAAARRILYLASLTASRRSHDMKAFYRRLIDNGKPPKSALIAMAGKLVLRANTPIAQDRLWQPLAPQNA